MIKFNKPKQFDSLQLINELLAAGIKSLPKSTQPAGYQVPFVEDDNFFLQIDISEKDLAQSVLDKHIPLS
jgi:hypothetical protein